MRGASPSVGFVARPTPDYSIRPGITGPRDASVDRRTAAVQTSLASLAAAGKQGDRRAAARPSAIDYGCYNPRSFSPVAHPEGSLMSTPTVRLHRWDEIALEKVTEMISRKIVTGDREMVAQIYLKKGALVPMHSHESEQMTYVLQGAMKFLVGGEEITLREGEVLHIPSWVRTPGRGARRHLRARRLQPHPPGLARSHRHVLSQVARRLQQSSRASRSYEATKLRSRARREVFASFASS